MAEDEKKIRYDSTQLTNLGKAQRKPCSVPRRTAEARWSARRRRARDGPARRTAKPEGTAARPRRTEHGGTGTGPQADSSATPRPRRTEAQGRSRGGTEIDPRRTATRRQAVGGRGQRRTTGRGQRRRLTEEGWPLAEGTGSVALWHSGGRQLIENREGLMAEG